MDSDGPSNQHRIHHLVWECNMRMIPLVEEAFADTELTVATAGTLEEIATTPGVTVAEIARRSVKTSQAISQAVARLEKLGFVERRLGSGRGVGLHLTPAGETAQADGVAREAAVERALAEMLGADLLASLTEALERARTRLLEEGDRACRDRPPEPPPS